MSKGEREKEIERVKGNRILSNTVVSPKSSPNPE